MKRLILFFCVLSSFLDGYAQLLSPPVNITSGEYFWDTNPGSGNGFPFTVSGELGEVTLSDLNLNLTGLEPGFHNLYLRFRDASGQWGIPTRYAYFLPKERVIETVTKAEYFLDTRTEGGSGTSISVLSDIETAAISDLQLGSDNFQKGFRKFYLRFGDNTQWGIPVLFTFFNPSERTLADITRAEFFFDNIGQAGTGTPLAVASPGQDVTFEDQNISLDNQPGFRKLFFRIGDATTWGIPIRASFYQPTKRDTTAISQAEYFFDTDPGLGNGNAIEITAGNSISIESSIPLSGVNDGFRNFYVRLKDASGQWGSYVKSAVYVPKVRASSSSIAAMEYFYSGTTAPAPGSGFAFEALDGSFNSLEESGAALTRISQPAGNYRVYARAKDAGNTWGIPTPQAFSVSNQRLIEGQIYIPSGSDSVATSNVLVNLYQNNALVDTDTTGFKGLFSFENLTAGTYEVQAIGSLNTQTGVQSVSARKSFVLGTSVPDVKTTSAIVRTPASVLSVSEGRNAIARVGNAPIKIRYSEPLNASSFNNKVTVHSASQGSLPVSLTFENGDSTLVVSLQKLPSVGTELNISIASGGQTKNGGSVLPFSSRTWTKVNRGAGEFGRIVKIDSVGFGSFVANELAVGDFDGDLDNDMAVLRQYGSGTSRTDSLVFRFNDGTGLFPNKKALRVFNDLNLTSGSSFQQYRLNAVDWDKDGDLDIVIMVEVVFSQYQTFIIIYKNDGNGTFARSLTSLPTVLAASATQVADYHIADVNHDGYPDILYTTANNRIFGVTNAGTGNLSATPIEIATSSAINGNSKITVSDFSNDGIVDLALYTYINASNTRIQLFRGTGSMFTSSELTGVDSSLSVSSGIIPQDLEAIDWDNNGRMDLYGFDDYNFFEWKNSNTYRGLTPNSAIRSGNATPGYYSSSTGHAIGDTDNDGNIEVLSAILTNSGGVISRIVNGQGEFGYKNNIASTGISSSAYRFPKLIDMDGDGDLDLVYNRYQTNNYGQVWVHFNSAVSTNRAPVLASGNDLTITREITLGTPFTKNLGTQFTDADGDAIVFSATSSNPSVASVTVSGSTLTVSGVTFGATTITVFANDLNGGIGKATFSAFISPSGNRVPRQVLAFRDTSIKVGKDPITLLLAPYFSDPENATLTYSVSSATTAVLSAAIVSTNQLRITPSASSTGAGSVTVRASDGTSYAEGTINVNIIPNINVTPVLTRALRDTTISPSNVAPYVIALGSYFSDPDADVLTYSASSSNTSIASVQVNNTTKQLTVTPTTSVGSANITVTAQDPLGLSVSDIFVVTKGNRNPILVKALRDTVLNTASPAYDISLNDYFSDPDAGTLTFGASSNSSAGAIVQILTSPSRLRVSPGTGGSATVTVTAQDAGGLSISDAFTVTTKSAPRTVAMLSAITAVTNTSSVLGWSMSQLFADADHSAAQLTTIFESNATQTAYFNRASSSVVTVVTGSTPGTATLTMKARDPDGFESSTLTLLVTVKERNFTSISTDDANSYYSEGIPARTWTLFSVPGNLADRTATSVFSDLEGDQAFKLYEISNDGVATEVSLSSQPFNPGKGYWFKTLAKDDPFTIASKAGSRYTSRAFATGFTSGWRFIASPFDSEALFRYTNSNAGGRIWQFDQDEQRWIELTATSRIKPWTAYAAYSFGATDIELTLVDGYTSVAKVSEEPLKLQTLWNGVLSVGSHKLVFGEADQASEEEDIFDYPLLPAAPGAKEAQVFWKVGKRALTSDIRPTESNRTTASLRKHELFLPAGKHDVSIVFEGASENRSLLIYGKNVYALLQNGESKTITMKEAGYVAVHSGEAELLERMAIPTEAMLYDAFPNPFNPTTVIRFGLAEQADVRLEVYDLTGRQIQLLVSKRMEAGFHTSTFDARNISSGVYLYRFAVNGKIVQTKKMMLVK